MAQRPRAPLPSTHRPETSFVQTRLQGPGFSTRKLFILISLVMALLIVIAGTFLLLSQIHDVRLATVQPTVITTPQYGFTLLPTYTPQPPPPTPMPGTPTYPPGKGAVPTPPAFPQPGWTPIGPAYATTVAFAPSDQRIGYACGPQHALSPRAASASGPGPQPYLVSSSQDTGQHWFPAVTLKAYEACTLSINPTNPKDVVISLFPCNLCAPEPPPDFQRSQDGGRTWQAMPMPSDPATPDGVFSLDVMWAGGTLFAGRYLGYAPPGATTHFIAASVNGQPLAWVDGNLRLDSTKGNFADLAYAIGPTCFIIVYTSTTPNTTPTTAYYRTTNAGVTWTATTGLTTNGTILSILAATPDGKTILGYDAGTMTGTLNGAFRSLDNGAHWQRLPDFPDQESGYTGFILPDGTLIFGVHPTNGNNLMLFKLVPGGAQWAMITSLNQTIDLLAVIADANGHPAAIWADAGRDGYDNLQQGLQAFQKP